MSLLIRPAGLWRRLGAAFYDALLILGIFLLLGFAVLLIRYGEPVPAGDPAFQLLLLLIAFAFNGWFWTHGGQTLGMRAWRLQLRRPDGGAISWPRALLRFAVALPAWGLGGIGVLWCLVDPQRLSWQDRFSATETVLIPLPES